MLSDWIDRVARAALPLTSVLVLRNLHATPVFLEALAGARKLRILDVHDGLSGAP